MAEAVGPGVGSEGGLGVVDPAVLLLEWVDLVVLL